MMRSDSWSDVREQFRHVVFRRGIQKVADAIPADRATVYRLVTGRTKEPTRAVRAGVERLVNEEQELEA